MWQLDHSGQLLMGVSKSLSGGGATTLAFVLQMLLNLIWLLQLHLLLLLLYSLCTVLAASVHELSLFTENLFLNQKKK